MIIAHRYGSITKKGRRKISYTQKEYEYAKSKKIPILAFIIHDDVVTNPKYIERQHQREFEKFINEVKTGRQVVWWKDGDELAKEVVLAIQKEISREGEGDSVKRPGWIRGESESTDDGRGIFKKLSWNEYYKQTANLIYKLKQSENLGGYEFNIIIGISRGGLAVADLMAREFGQNMPILGLYSYREDGHSYYDSDKCKISNEYIINIIRESDMKRILLVDSFTRNGVSVFMARDYLQEKLPDRVIKTAVIYVNKRLDEKIVSEIDYIGQIIDLDGKKLSLE